MRPLSFASVEGGVYNVGFITTGSHDISFVKTPGFGSSVKADINAVKLL